MSEQLPAARTQKMAGHESQNAPMHEPHIVTRPLPFFHPTRATFAPHHLSQSAKDQVEGGRHARWSARASRKNRYTRQPLRLPRHPAAKREVKERLHPDASPSVSQQSFALVEQRVRDVDSRLKVHLAWDLSFWVAVIFVLGSSVWVANGFVLFLPLVDIGSDDFAASAWSAFAGGTLFEIGSYLMYVEALNTGHEELFGGAVRGLLEHGTRTTDRDSSPDSHSRTGSEDAEKSLTDGGRRTSSSSSRFRWIGFGSWHELGFLACFVQLWAATIFWVSTITGLPNVIPGLPQHPPTAITDVFFWSPQVIGGSGFIISSLLLMIEVQKKWWLPNVRSMGWHIGFWNLVGAVGFTLCGALGYGSLSSSPVNYQSVLSTYWGSWAFLIGSVVQLWETIWREDPSSSGPDPK